MQALNAFQPAQRTAWDDIRGLAQGVGQGRWRAQGVACTTAFGSLCSPRDHRLTQQRPARLVTLSTEGVACRWPVSPAHKGLHARRLSAAGKEQSSQLPGWLDRWDRLARGLGYQGIAWQAHSVQGRPWQVCSWQCVQLDALLSVKGSHTGPWQGCIRRAPRRAKDLDFRDVAGQVAPSRSACGSGSSRDTPPSKGLCTSASLTPPDRVDSWQRVRQGRTAECKGLVHQGVVGQVALGEGLRDGLHVCAAPGALRELLGHAGHRHVAPLGVAVPVLLQRGKLSSAWCAQSWELACRQVYDAFMAPAYAPLQQCLSAGAAQS